MSQNNSTADGITEQIAYRNPVKRLGWAQVYHVLTLDRTLSDGAFRTYALLLMYAQQSDGCWPGVDRLAKNLNRTSRTVARYLAELGTRGLITRQQRLHRTAVTWIEDVEAVYGLEAIPDKYVIDEKSIPDKFVSHLSLTNLSGHEEEQERTISGDGGDTDTIAILVEIGVSSIVARSLVSTCSPDQVIGWVSYAQAAKGLSNPAAFVVSRLKAGEPAPEMKPEGETGSRRYVSGRYAHLIQH